VVVMIAIVATIMVIAHGSDVDGFDNNIEG